MVIKKSELYSLLWVSLRGGMAASQYKDYILQKMGFDVLGKLRMDRGE